MLRPIGLLAGFAILLGASACGSAKKSGPHGASYDAAWFATDVSMFDEGDGAGYGASDLPAVVLGPPKGHGEGSGSTDVVSLGIGGEIVLELGESAVDGEGVDLIVFENPFMYGSGDVFTEPGFVAVSEDGITWKEFDCDPETLVGCAGVTPVFSNADENEIDPTDVAAAGGDGFDLADVGLSQAKYVRIRDAGTGTLMGNSSGFDLDAVVTVHRAEDQAP